jgi:hypothetical protein
LKWVLSLDCWMPRVVFWVRPIKFLFTMSSQSYSSQGRQA